MNRAELAFEIVTFGPRDRTLQMVRIAVTVKPPLPYVRMLNVVTPFKVCWPGGVLVKVTPPPCGLNAPLLFHVPLIRRAKLLELASRVVPDPIVRFPLMVTTPPRDFVPLPLVVRWL